MQWRGPRVAGGVPDCVGPGGDVGEEVRAAGVEGFLHEGRGCVGDEGLGEPGDGLVAEGAPGVGHGEGAEEEEGGGCQGENGGVHGCE